MFIAEFDFVSNHKHILNFKNGERFLDFDRIHRNGWIYVINEHLQTGYIPLTYVKSSSGGINNESEISFIEQLIAKAEHIVQETEDVKEKERCMKIVQQLQNKGNTKKQSGDDSGIKPSVAAEIHTTDIDVQNCQNSISEIHLKDLKDQNCQNSDSEIHTKDLEVQNHQKPVLKIHTKDMDVHNCQNSVTDSPQPIICTEELIDISPPRSKVEETLISNLLGCELIEHVHCDTGLGHKQARMAVESTLEFLVMKLPSVKSTAMAILTLIKGTSPSGEALENAHDWQRLRCIFSTILDIKSDVEQLNWALYEDQHIITEFLEELLGLLTDGDPVVCKHFLKKDQYRNVEALVQYFQMEIRGVIRQVLLKVFAALCSLDRLCISVLVNSDLPLLLAREIQDSKHDQQRLVYSSLVLTMLMWTGESMPITHYDTLNVKFVDYLLDLMDDNSSEDSEQTADSSTELLLAFNIQFRSPQENIIMQALMDRSTAEEFLRKLIVLANREDDPVGSMFDHDEPPPNSVHKMLLDIFSQKGTANLFYTNDLKVFIEIVARKLLDLSPDDKIQMAYMHLAYNIICNTNYAEHCHCQDEFQQCFLKTMQEDTNSPEESKTIVRQLCTHFPNLFHA